jgi:nucleoside-diphosphate-sugar epimerase
MRLLKIMLQSYCSLEVPVFTRKMAPQPLKEEYMLTGPLEQTNEPYGIAKIAGIKLCEAYKDQYGCNFISVMLLTCMAGEIITI